MTGKYFIKKKKDISYRDISSLFDGVQILKIDGFLSKGKPLNVYHQQWNDSEEEDFCIVSDTNDIIRENTDITISFIVSNKYAKANIDVRLQHDIFINYLTKSDVYIKSEYVGKEAHFVALEDYQPSVVKLHRDTSYILGTIKLHKIGDK